MNSPLVSILVITYNQAHFVAETLQSSLKQDYDNVEVVVADDGSTDDTPKIISALSREFPERLVPITGGNNLGITGNSNRGLRHCRGKYIALQGGDDLLLPGKIRKQVDWFEKDEQRVLCGHDSQIIDERGNPLGLYSSKIPLMEGKGPEKIILHASLFSATSVMLRKSMIPEYGFDERIKFVSDWKIQVDCLRNGGSFGFVDGVLAKYRLHQGGITSRRKIACYLDSIFCLHQIIEQYPENLALAIRKEGEYQLVLAYLLLRQGDIPGFFIASMKSLWLTRVVHLPSVIGNVLRMRKLSC